MLVMLAFLVEAAAAHRKFRLAPPALRGFCAAIALPTRKLLLDLPLIGDIRLPFEHAYLLLMRLLSLQRHFPRPAIPIVLRWPAASVANLRLVDSALRIGVILDIAFEGVGALEFLQIVGRYLRHRGSLRATDQRIAIEIDVGRPVQFHMLGAHDVLFEAGWVPPPLRSG